MNHIPQQLFSALYFTKISLQSVAFKDIRQEQNLKLKFSAYKSICELGLRCLKIMHSTYYALLSISTMRLTKKFESLFHFFFMYAAISHVEYPLKVYKINVYLFLLRVEAERNEIFDIKVRNSVPD